MRRHLLLTTLGLFLVLSPSADALEELRSPCVAGSNYPLSAINDSGQMLVTWQQDTVEHETCVTSASEAASGSPAAGFATLGRVSQPGLSFPTSVFLDDAGNGWVTGVGERVAGSKYGQELERSGAWVAFRPAGAGFQPPAQLARAGAPASPILAGNRSGRVLLAWDTPGGSHLAWGEREGRLTRPVYYGRGLQVTGVSVADDGRGLVAGYYPASRSRGREIVLITSRGDSFSHPRLLAPRRDLSSGRRVDLGTPIFAGGAGGQAVIAWEESQAGSAGRDTLVYRRADGGFNRPIHFATGFLRDPSPLAEPSHAFVDRDGRGLLVQENSLGLEALTVDGRGRPSAPERFLTGAFGQLSLAGDATGGAIATWDKLGEGGGIGFLVGTTRGLPGPAQTLPGTQIGGAGFPAPVIAPSTPATLVWVASASAQPDSLFASVAEAGASTLAVPTPAP